MKNLHQWGIDLFAKMQVMGDAAFGLDCGDILPYLSHETIRRMLDDGLTHVVFDGGRYMLYRDFYTIKLAKLLRMTSAHKAMLDKIPDGQYADDDGWDRIGDILDDCYVTTICSQ